MCRTTGGPWRLSTMETDNGKDYNNSDKDGDHDNDYGLGSVKGRWRGNARMTDEVQREEVVT